MKHLHQWWHKRQVTWNYKTGQPQTFLIQLVNDLPSSHELVAYSHPWIRYSVWYSNSRCRVVTEIILIKWIRPPNETSAKNPSHPSRSGFSLEQPKAGQNFAVFPADGASRSWSPQSDCKGLNWVDFPNELLSFSDARTLLTRRKTSFLLHTHPSRPGLRMIKMRIFSGTFLNGTMVVITDAWKTKGLIAKLIGSQSIIHLLSGITWRQITKWKWLFHRLVTILLSFCKEDSIL